MEIIIYLGGSALSVIYLVIHLWLGPIPVAIDIAFSSLLLITLGIPHGAGDHLIAKEIAKGKQQIFHLPKFIVLYLLIMLAYLLVWLAFPMFSFILFLLISVFHFGDLEFTHEPRKNPTKLEYVLLISRNIGLGSGILGWILLQHPLEMNSILSDIGLDFQIQVPHWVSYIFLALVLMGFQRKNALYFLNTFITLIIGAYLPLIPAFMLYFAACHAGYSLMAMVSFLNISLKSLLAKLFPFGLAAVILGIIFISYIDNRFSFNYIFVFLSLLTLPHFLLMHQCVNRKTAA